MNQAPTKIADFKSDFGLLIEAGFVAVKQLDEISSKRIFHAAQLLHPDSTAPQIGLGYIALNKLELKEATRIFLEVLEKEPENHLAQCFLGISYLLTIDKREDGEKLLKDAIKKSDEPTIHDLGKIALEWADKDLKKEKSPLFGALQKQQEAEKNAEKEKKM